MGQIDPSIVLMGLTLGTVDILLVDIATTSGRRVKYCSFCAEQSQPVIKI